MRVLQHLLEVDSDFSVLGGLQDVVKLGNSSREYVLLHEGSLNA